MKHKNTRHKRVVPQNYFTFLEQKYALFLQRHANQTQYRNW